VFFFAAFDKDTVNSFSNPAHIIFGLGIALLILGLTVREKFRGLAVPKMLVTLGDASYALYLIHVPAISVAVRIAGHLPFLGNWPGAMCFSSCCAAAAGLIYYGAVERPALSAIRKTAYRPNSRARTAVTRPVTPP
jgi:exopolysaccharide production protein ExoZ